MFLEEINIIKTSPCLAEEEKIRVQALLSAKIGELLPYLNAVLPNPNYDPTANILTFKKEEKLFCLQDQRVSITKLRNLTHAYQEIDWLKNLINDTYAKRDSITPAYEGKKRPAAVQVYKLLPRTNCKLCGQPSCLAFANKLSQMEAEINQCQPVFEEKYNDQRADLLKLLGE